MMMVMEMLMMICNDDLDDDGNDNFDVDDW